MSLGLPGSSEFSRSENVLNRIAVGLLMPDHGRQIAMARPRYGSPRRVLRGAPPAFQHATLVLRRSSKEKGRFGGALVKSVHGPIQSRLRDEEKQKNS